MHKYEEIMDKVYMTENMQERILKKIRNTTVSFQANAVKKRKRERLAAIFCLSAAACIVVIALYQINPVRISNQAVQSQTAGYQESDRMQAIWNVTECSSVKELSDKVGFAVSEIDAETLPFAVKEISYLAYPDMLAEVNYRGSKGEEVSYREGIGSGDISGDYNSYQQTQTIDIQNVEIVLKGEQGIYRLAIWQKDGHAYSLSISEGADERVWTKILMSVQ